MTKNSSYQVSDIHILSVKKDLRASVHNLFLVTAFYAMLAAIPSDLLDVATATSRRVFEVFR
ncbi:MAG: hypothetical protein AAB975_04595, partial [Patescibacteria group bacterium]